MSYVQSLVWAATCPLYGPQIPQVFVRGWQHTDTWTKTTHTQTKMKTKVIAKGKLRKFGKKETEKVPLIGLQFSRVMQWEKLQHVLAVLQRWHSEWLNMCGTCKEFMAMTALLWAIGMLPNSHGDAKQKFSLKTRLLERKMSGSTCSWWSRPREPC